VTCLSRKIATDCEKALSIMRGDTVRQLFKYGVNVIYNGIFDYEFIELKQTCAVGSTFQATERG